MSRSRAGRFAGPEDLPDRHAAGQGLTIALNQKSVRCAIPEDSSNRPGINLCSSFPHILPRAGLDRARCLATLFAVRKSAGFLTRRARRAKSLPLLVCGTSYSTGKYRVVQKAWVADFPSASSPAEEQSEKEEAGGDPDTAAFARRTQHSTAIFRRTHRLAACSGHQA